MEARADIVHCVEDLWWLDAALGRGDGQLRGLGSVAGHDGLRQFEQGGYRGAPRPGRSRCA